jgi:hypothetical protein
MLNTGVAIIWRRQSLLAQSPCFRLTIWRLDFVICEPLLRRRIAHELEFRLTWWENRAGRLPSRSHSTPVRQRKAHLRMNYLKMAGCARQEFNLRPAGSKCTCVLGIQCPDTTNQRINQLPSSFFLNCSPLLCIRTAHDVMANFPDILLR